MSHIRLVTEIQPGLYPSELTQNPVLLLYGNCTFCHLLAFTSAIWLMFRMLKWMSGLSEIHLFKPMTLVCDQCMWEENQALCLHNNISQFVSEPSREEADILKIILAGIFMLACEGSAFGAMSKSLCHWISRNAVKFVPKMVREALTNSRADTFDAFLL